MELPSPKFERPPTREYRHLGDSIYVEIEDGLVKLTTQHGATVVHTIYLEVEVMDALESWWTYVQEKYKRRGWE
jgi:hypothetical protein